MIKWTDKVKDYKDKEIISSETKIGKFRLSIHRHISCEPDVWLASSYDLFGTIEMKSKNLDFAKSQAVAKAQIILESALNDITHTQ